MDNNYVIGYKFVTSDYKDGETTFAVNAAVSLADERILFCQHFYDLYRDTDNLGGDKRIVKLQSTGDVYEDDNHIYYSSNSKSD